MINQKKLHSNEISGLQNENSMTGSELLQNHQDLIIPHSNQNNRILSDINQQLNQNGGSSMDENKDNYHAIDVRDSISGNGTEHTLGAADVVISDTNSDNNNNAINNINSNNSNNNGNKLTLRYSSG